jgi:ABC-type branched-subunit amino acid transport system permease subunit
VRGIAGALYVPQVGIINPGEMSPANSIEIAVWVAVGGRGTLIGPIVGAFIVNLSEELVHPGLSAVLAVLPRPAVRRSSRCSAARRGGPGDVGASARRGAGGQT